MIYTVETSTQRFVVEYGAVISEGRTMLLCGLLYRVDKVVGEVVHVTLISDDGIIQPDVLSGGMLL